MSERVTLTTIAERLGISRATVSNAYNRPDQLSRAMRERIFAAAREVGYAGPDPRASALRSGRVGAIGLIERSMPAAVTDPATVLVLGGIARACDDAGIALLLIPRCRGADSAHDLVRSAVVDGFVAHCDALDDERRTIVEDRRLPFVLLDGQSTPADPWVGIDEEGGSYAAARHLLDLGHRRLAVVKFPPSAAGHRNMVTVRRLAGYKRAMAENGDVAVTYVDGSPFDRAETAAVARDVLTRVDRPTGILAMSDEMAAAFVDAAAELGIAVPGELSVVGFDDTPTARWATPPLTTVHQPHGDKGAAAVHLLLGTCAGTAIELPTQLVVRSSTAPAPA
jgi:DNA-binding LacI/PurR family transcriptional regulator